MGLVVLISWWSFRLLLRVVSALLLLVWLPHTNITIDLDIVSGFGALEIAMIALWAFSLLAVHRSRNDGSSFGRGFAATFGATRDVTLYLILLIAAFVPAGMLTYVAVAIGGPLADDILSAADLAIGFDWQWFLAFTNGMPLLVDVLQFCYHSYYWQFLAMPFVLVAARQPRRLLEFAAATALAALLTTVISAFVPAIGPFAHYHVTPDQFSSFDRMAGGWHLTQYEALRSGAPVVLKSGVGLVAFPSFHTILAIVICFAARRIPYIRFALLIVNSLLIIGAVPVGGHYLVDILAGALVAAVSIAVVKTDFAVPLRLSPEFVAAISRSDIKVQSKQTR